MAAARVTRCIKRSKNLTAEPDGVVILYAQWQPISYTVHFEANEGSGTMTDQAFTYDIYQNLKTNAYTRAGWTFVDWNTKADGSGINYGDEEIVHNLTAENGAVVTLFAQWTRNLHGHL